MRDFVLFAHIIIGLALVVLPVVILLELRPRLAEKSSLLKPLSLLTALLGWLILIPAGRLYILFYPATKTLVKAGAWPWAHSILMETKEHWGLLLPFIATVAAGLVLTGKFSESKKWWILLSIVSLLIAVMGRVIKIAALQQ